MLEGKGAPICFTPRSEVPIVGQPFVVKGGYATTLVQCTCGAREPVLLVGQAPNFCPACDLGFRVSLFSIDEQGQLKVGIRLVRRAPEEPPPFSVVDPAAS